MINALWLEQSETMDHDD
ncbi:MAG: hypothetical protein ACRCT2_14730 [Plesiomonas shigelloides]